MPLPAAPALHRPVTAGTLTRRPSWRGFAAGRPLHVGRPAGFSPRRSAGWSVIRAGAVDAHDAEPSSEQLYLQNGRPHLSTSLFRPFERLPPDGKTLTPEEEGCDPESGLCKTKIHVWEVKCHACYGTGTIISNGGRRGHRTMHTCLLCTGLGYVRHTSSMVEPVKEEENSEAYYTLARPPPPLPKQPAKKRHGAPAQPRRPRPGRR